MLLLLVVCFDAFGVFGVLASGLDVVACCLQGTLCRLPSAFRFLLCNPLIPVCTTPATANRLRVSCISPYHHINPQEAVGADVSSAEELYALIQKAVQTSAIETVTMTIATQRRCVLEAVAFGTFLRDVETGVQTDYNLLTPLPPPKLPPGAGGFGSREDDDDDDGGLSV